MLEQLLRLMRQIAPAGDLILPAAAVLARPVRDGPQRLTELATYEGVSHPWMTQLVTRLERDRLARRMSGNDDRRVVLVEVTGAGRRLVEGRRAQRADVLRHLLGRLDGDDGPPSAARYPLARQAELVPTALSTRRRLARSRPARSAETTSDRTARRPGKPVPAAPRGTYGSPRIALELRAAGLGGFGEYRGRADGRAGAGRQGGAPTARRDPPGSRSAAADLVNRNFTADRPNAVWVGDVSQIRTGRGPLLLASVLDLFSRLRDERLPRRRADRRVVADGRRQPGRRRRPGDLP